MKHATIFVAFLVFVVRVAPARTAPPNTIESLTRGQVEQSCSQADLLRFAHGNELSLVQKCLDHHVDPNIANKDDMTPLALAVVSNNLAMVNGLLGAGADPNFRRRPGPRCLSGIFGCPMAREIYPEATTPLLWACRRRYMDIAEALLAHGADPNVRGPSGRTPLSYAAEANDLGMVKKFLTMNVKVNIGQRGGLPLEWAFRNGNVEMVKELTAHGAKAYDLNGSYEQSPLFSAIFKKEWEIVKLLAAAGANVCISGEFGQTPLHYACEESQLEVVQALLAAGARVNAFASNGGTPLMLTTNPAIAEILINAGAKVNIVNSQGSPLNRAVYRGNTAMVDLLLRKGAKLDIGSPLLNACKSGNMEMIMVLLSHGANPLALSENGKGLSPREWAVANGRDDILELLESYNL